MADVVGCRWCSHPDRAIVLDLGRQPAADHFPAYDERGGTSGGIDQRWPLVMGLCRSCGLAQLMQDPGTTDEPRGIEPQALLDQAHEAVAAVTAAGLLGPGRTIREFDSPHGGSWRTLLTEAGCLDRTGTDEPADVVVDVFGLMHEADQRAALRERVRALAPGGTLLLQFHSLASIVRQQQWNALRHGHMAYYATSTLAQMVDDLGLTPQRAWTFDLYGGTVLLAAAASPVASGDATLIRLRGADAGGALQTTAGLAGLSAAVTETADELVAWLAGHRDEGRRVIGYGAASRAVPLLVRAGIDVDLLPAVADASPAKGGLRMPGSQIPIVPADRLRTGDDDVVLLFVPDLLGEVRAAYPQVTARGAAWAVSEPRPHVVHP